MIRPIALAAAAAMAASAASASDKVSQGDMPKYCQGEAAAKFDRSPRDISTLPAERGDAGYEVYGQIGDGDDALFFICDYAEDGTFKDVHKNSGGAKRDKVAVKDMADYCRGEASAEFKVLPNDITMEQVEENDHGGHFVRGSFEKDGGKIQHFTCRYGEQGGFRRIASK